MVFFNHATRQMTTKIVYYGPGLCGKTTNLSADLWSHLPEGAGRDGVPQHRDGPHPVLRSAAHGRGHRRRVQDQAPALHGARAGLLQLHPQAGAQGGGRHRVRGRQPDRHAGRQPGEPPEPRRKPAGTGPGPQGHPHGVPVEQAGPEADRRRWRPWSGNSTRGHGQLPGHRPGRRAGSSKPSAASPGWPWPTSSACTWAMAAAQGAAAAPEVPARSRAAPAGSCPSCRNPRPPGAGFRPLPIELPRLRHPARPSRVPRKAGRSCPGASRPGTSPCRGASFLGCAPARAPAPRRRFRRP